MSIFLNPIGSTIPKYSEITLATFVKNEEHCIEHMIKSVAKYVQELVVVDTGSTDRTMEICKDYGARIYQIGFTDFGNLRTITAHLCRSDWVLMLDADESLSNPHLLAGLIRQNESLAYAFPRKRWLDLDMIKQTEIEAYPDYQVRLFKNYPQPLDPDDPNRCITWRRELHEEFNGGVVSFEDNGPVIHHFQDVFKDNEANRIRKELYERLSKKAGVSLHGGKVINETSG